MRSYYDRDDRLSQIATRNRRITFFPDILSFRVLYSLLYKTVLPLIFLFCYHNAQRVCYRTAPRFPVYALLTTRYYIIPTLCNSLF